MNDPFFWPLGEMLPKLGRVSRPIQPDAAPVDDLPPPPPVPEEKPKARAAKLSNPRWETDSVGFNEETPISVQLELPPDLAHKTKVTFDLFAKTPKGPEKISQGDANARDGKAIVKIPVYIPGYQDKNGERLRKVEYYFNAQHSEAEPLDGSKSPKLVEKMADRVLEVRILQNVTFATGKSFIRASEAADLEALGKAVKDWKAKHSDGKLAVFGHADAVGEEVSNKTLSERRANSVHAYLAKDPKPWEVLYSEEKWGLASVQELLRHLGHDPGVIDGQDGPKTQAAVKDFQGKQGLGQTGSADAKTREALFLAYFEKAASPASAAKDFDVIDGKAFSGCSEFNLFDNTQGANETNRRVAVLMLKVSKNFPINYPCKQGAILPCQKQAGLKGDRRTPGFRCKFYDGLVTEKAGPTPVPKKEETTLKGRLFWNRTWDYLDETVPIAAVKEFLPGAKVDLEIKKAGEADFKAFGSAIHLTDDIVKALTQPHDGAGNFAFQAVPKCEAARVKISLEYAGGKIVVVKGKTIKGNTKFKDEADFKIHSGKTVFHILPLKLDTVDWTAPESDLGEVEIAKAMFVDICDAYKSVWTGHKPILEMTSHDLPVCQVNFPEDPDITVSNAGDEMQLCNDDLKDRAVILHEYGHFIGTKLLGGLAHPGYGYNDDPTNSHGGNTLEHYESAWNEGHATFLSCAMTDNPHYHDGYDTNLNFFLDSDGTKLGPHCEGSIQEALWAILKTHQTDFKEGFWKAFTDRTHRTCRTIFDFFDNWRDLKLPKLDKVAEAFKDFGKEFGYLYPDGKFRNVAAPKTFDEAKQEFAAIGELHTHKGSLGAGTLVQYNEEFYNRNKHFNAGALKAGSSIAAPKVSVGKDYIAPERFQVNP